MILKSEEARRRLTEWQRRLQDEIDRLRGQGLAESETGSVQELSGYDNHPADLGSETFEREKDLGLLGGSLDLLAKVEDALSKLEAGTYGRCVACGEEIPAGRLVALPWAERCIACEERIPGVDRHPRPIEEDVLGVPFAPRQGSAFAGEDVWQEVERVGTSEGPQDVPPAVNYNEIFVGGEQEKRVGSVEDVELEVDDRGDVNWDMVRRLRRDS